MFWTGAITSILLLSWAAGGRAIRLDRRPLRAQRALFATIAIYAIGTALCALATNLTQLRPVPHRGGARHRWRVGHRRGAGRGEHARGRGASQAGVIMQTASPLGMVFASSVNYQIAGVWFASQPQQFVALRVSRRPCCRWLVALAVRAVPARERALAGQPRARGALDAARAVRTAACWRATRQRLLRGGHRGPDLVGLQRVHPAARQHARRTSTRAASGLPPAATRQLAAAWQAHASNAFNLGGLAGALAALPLPAARPPAACSSPTSCFRPPRSADLRRDARAADATGDAVPGGAGVFGMFGTFTFYLPELFPARLRATGAGFCYNIGRVFAAIGPFAVGYLSARGRRLERSALAHPVVGGAGAAGGRAPHYPAGRRDPRPPTAALAPRVAACASGAECGGQLRAVADRPDRRAQAAPAS